MTIYVDDGETVKIYPVKVKVAKAVMTLLETDEDLLWSRTHEGYGVEIVDKAESDPQESDLGDYPDAIHNQFDNMTGSMNL